MGRYLSAPVHAVIISGETNDYLQMHPAEKEKVNLDTTAGMKGMERIWIISKAPQAAGEKSPISSEISARSFPVVSRSGLGAQLPAWWASDYGAFRVERCDCFTRLRQGINLKLSGITKQARIIRGTRRKAS